MDSFQLQMYMFCVIVLAICRADRKSFVLTASNKRQISEVSRQDDEFCFHVMQKKKKDRLSGKKVTGNRVHCRFQHTGKKRTMPQIIGPQCHFVSE